MKSKEALNEIKNYTLISYDENREEDDCTTFGELEPNLIEPIEKDLDRLEKYDKVKEFLKTNPSHLSAILGFDNYETFKNYYSYYYTKDVDEEMFNLVKEVFNGKL